MSDNPYRRIPAVHQVIAAMPRTYPQALILEGVRAELTELRKRLVTESEASELTVEGIAARVMDRLARTMSPRLQPVINATGIVLHTNLGRAPLARQAVQALVGASGYTNLELDLATGRRSSRQDAVREWLTQLSGAAAATVVNNCAAATVLVLRALAAGKEVIVSRGQLVEIGGGFRIPEIMAVSGATLREIGTTNITRLVDYERAITPNTAVLMRVHQSNFRLRGFARAVPLQDLVALGHSRGLLVVDDIGSGALFDLEAFGLTGEPVVRESILAGADVVLFSGDKLLGGPQAGIILGSVDLIHQMERDPLMRAFRLDKLTLAALEATLRLCFDENRARDDVPVLRMLTASPTELRHRCERLAARLRELPGLRDVIVLDDVAFTGGGSFPDIPLATSVIAVTVAGSETMFAARLRAGRPAVVARIQEGTVRLDPRTILPEQEDALIEAVLQATRVDGAAPVDGQTDAGDEVIGEEE